MPSVEVNDEGTVSLRGNESVTVWINGKSSGLTEDNRGDILQQLPAESIERIEVITNPSSKYSPEGTAGIINIVLKRDHKAGYYGGVRASVNTHKGGSLGANINYSTGVYELFANVGYRRHRPKNGSSMERTSVDADGSAQSLLYESSDGGMDGNVLFLQAGGSWRPSDADEVGLSYMGHYGGHDRYADYAYVLLTPSLDTTYTRSRRQDQDGKMRLTVGDFSYKHTFAPEHTVEARASVGKWHMENDLTYEDYTFFRLPDEYELPSYQTQETDMPNKWVEAQADYSRTFDNTMKIEAGWKGNFNKDRNVTSAYVGTAADGMAFDPQLYNRFIYDSKVNALYCTFGGMVGNLSYQAGLRGERTHIETQPVAWDEKSDAEQLFEAETTTYTDFFPSFFVSYSMPRDNEVQINYTRRVKRPWGRQLNSFRNISDATTIEFGNPLLTPEYSNAYEFNYIKSWERHMLSVSAYYRTTDDIIQRINYKGDDGMMYRTFDNVSNSVSTGFELVAKNKLFRILDLSSTLNVYYFHLDGYDFVPNGATSAIHGASDENFTWNLRMMAGFMLPASISLQVTGDYKAREVIAQGYRKPGYNMEAGMRKSFFDNKLSVNANVRDIFNSRKRKSHTSGEGFVQDSERWFGGRMASLTLSWSFGNMSVGRNKKSGLQQGDDAMQFDDEAGGSRSSD